MVRCCINFDTADFSIQESSSWRGITVYTYVNLYRIGNCPLMPAQRSQKRAGVPFTHDERSAPVRRCARRVAWSTLTAGPASLYSRTNSALLFAGRKMRRVVRWQRSCRQRMCSTESEPGELWCTVRVLLKHRHFCRSGSLAAGNADSP